MALLYGLKTCNLKPSEAIAIATGTRLYKCRQASIRLTFPNEDAIMSLKTILINCCCLLALLAGCASVNTMDNYTTGDSMLVIGVQLKTMNSAGDVTGNADQSVSAVAVKNLATGQVYHLDLDSGHAIAQLPAGNYCVDSLTPEGGQPLEYCIQPYFTLTARKIVVTGYFIFGYDRVDRSYTMSDSFVDKQGLFNSLSKTEIKTLEDFDATKDE
jgi:hypothetical protein